MALTRPISVQAPLRTPAARVQASVHALAEWPRWAPVWEQLLSEQPGYSVFLTLPWIETWLETFEDALDANVLILSADDLVVGAGLMVKSGPSLARPLRRISMNASGESAADTTYVEFNNVLARKDWEAQAGEALARQILRQPWEELALDGFCPGPAYDGMKRMLTGMPVQEVWRPSYYVDLAALRTSGNCYLSALTPSHRRHLQQNLRYHSERGELAVQAASGTSAALEMFEELAALNRRRRETLRRRSVFSSERFAAFHRSFIRKTFPSGTVQMLRLTSGTHTVGLVYSLIRLGKVYFYQCGYNYTGDKRLSPGSVTLALAIQHCLEQGFDEFDFLAGEAAYKASMSTGSRSLVWATFRRPGARVWAYEAAREIRSKIKSHAGAAKL